MSGVRSPYSSPRGSQQPTILLHRRNSTCSACSTSATSPPMRLHMSFIGAALFVSGAIYLGAGGGTTSNSSSSHNSSRSHPGPPILTTGQEEFDWAYRLALEEIDANVGEGDRFIAGEGWAQLWTRDSSYAAESAASLLYPDVVRSSLEASVEVDPNANNADDDAPPLVWLQDSCAHFGGWPVLSDAIVGARGAWSLYLVGGNRTFLSWAYDVTRNSLIRGERDAFDVELGLFRGCSSFMESNSGYPARYHHRGDLINQTKALSTNVLYASGYAIAAKMGRELNKDESEIQQHEDKAARLRNAIRTNLWLEKEGYYGYVLDENGALWENVEGLGSALVILDGIEIDSLRVHSIFDNVKQQRYGLPCVWPRFELKESIHIAQYYHNGRLWPFVQGYFAIAAARYGRIDVFEHALEALKNLAVKSGTLAEFYELNGTFPAERSRQLWSDTGYLAMIFQGLFGMTFEVDGLRFAPVKPVSLFPLKSPVTLTNFRYQKMILDISIQGSGSHIETFQLDRKKQNILSANAFVSSNLKGRHEVVIVMRDVSK